MRMKRFFTNKQKKKKLHDSSDGIFESKPSEISADSLSINIKSEISDSNTRSAGKKKQRHHKKKPKSLKKQNSNDSDVATVDAAGLTYRAPDGTTVVLRRPDCVVTNRSLLSHETSGTEITNKRIPGSESSSRTASSASASSSSSSQRWSVRRPWSLVDPFRGHNLDEFSPSQNSSLHDFSDIAEDSHPVSSICTLPRGTDPNDSSLERNKHKSMMLDFSFFRRFKRSSLLMSSEDHHRNLDSANSEAPVSDERRGSFRLKNFTKNKKNKKKRRSWNDPNSCTSQYARTESYTPSSQPDVDFTGKKMMSPTDSLNFDPIEASIPEEHRSSADNLSSRSQSNGSSAGTYVVTSESEHSSKTPSECTSKRSSATYSSQDMLQDDDSEDMKQRHRRCSRVSCNAQLPTTDRGPEFYVEAGKKALTSKSSNHTPCRVAHSLEPCTSASLGDICDSGTITNSSSTTVQAGFGGSLITLPYAFANQENVTATTLPRRRCIADDEKFKLQSPKNNAIYASSPQLSVANRRSVVDRSRDRPTSTLLQLSEEKKPSFTVRLRSGSSSTTKYENAVVDSPVKRAIGYPGVVLRRHQNRHSKKSNDTNLTKSASSDFLSGAQRSKQVLSLNMEDLPTYEKMRNDSRWRASTVSASGGLSKATCRMSEETGRERLRVAVLYHRYASHCTSSDNVNDVQFLLGKGHSIEDIENMDEDEFLNLYLSGAPANSPSQNVHRSGQNQEPSSKRVKTLRKSVASFANLISPGKPGRNKLQRSSSFKESSGPTFKPYRPPGSHNNNSSSSSSGGVSASSGSTSTPGRRGTGSATKTRGSKLWCETFDHSGLDRAELKRQEAIFELYQGERIMVQDLKMAKQTYRDSMMTLKMLTAEEVTRIFGKLDCLPPLHDDLLSRLEQARAADGRINMVGQVFIDWFPTLSPYNEYCANQADAKETLDAVVNREKRVRDFLQRCLESPFSRKLDLWSYLDLPRSRLVKYPLLLKAILKVTPPDHEDTALLQGALKIINDIIARVDYLTGERQSRFVQSKLEYLDDKQKCKDVDNSRKILCSGQLKSSRGTKLHVFLFDLALVLTRNATRGEKLTYQVYRQPLPLKSLVVETEEGGKLSGSFRGGLLSSDKAKHSFRVKSEELNVTYTLIAADEHDKKQWVNSLQEAINEFRPSLQSAGNQSPISRRAGSEKSTLDKSGAKPAVTVKRSASVKSESGSSSPWQRNRSMTVNGNPVRRNSKEKNDLKKKSKLSPLSIRRNSKPEALSLSKPANVVKPTKDEKVTESGENSCKRSRSLTSSPITLIANLPKRSPRRESALARSESCSSKPPSGRVHALTNHYDLRSGSRTPPRSPRLSTTRSIPDLSKTQNDTQLSLEDVKKQLSPKNAETNTESPITLDSTEPSQNLSLSHKTSHFPTVPPLMVYSADHPAASDTSQDFPIVEEDVLSPMCKSLVVTSSPLSLVTSSTTFPDVMALPLSPPSVVTIRPKLHSIENVDSSSTSSESLDDVNLLMDDVEMILEEAGEEQSDDDRIFRLDENPVNSCVTTPDVQSDVLDTLNDVIDLVCQQHGVVPCSDEIESCRDDGVTVTVIDDVTVTTDAGLPWQGNNVEVIA